MGPKATSSRTSINRFYFTFVDEDDYRLLVLNHFVSLSRIVDLRFIKAGHLHRICQTDSTEPRLGNTPTFTFRSTDDFDGCENVIDITLTNNTKIKIL